MRFTDIAEEAQRVTLGWQSTSDILVKEPVYTITEQVHNDQELERIKRWAQKIMSKRRIGKLENVMHESGITGRTMRYVGSGILWLALQRWSAVFLKKNNQQRIGDAQKWLDLCLRFENTMKQFRLWVTKKYPGYSRKEMIKAVRMIWVATFLSATKGTVVPINSEALFSAALLYPLVDDYLDTEHDFLNRHDFVARLKDKLGQKVKPSAMMTWTSPHPESQLVGELVESVLQRFPESSPNRSLMIEILSSLLDHELERNPSDPLYSAAMKGGLTLCVTHLLIFESISPSNLGDLFKLGLALQVVDDLQDIQEDLAEANMTIATKYVYSSPSLRQLFARTINYVRHEVFPSTMPKKAHAHIEEGVNIVLQENLVLMCMESASNSTTLLPMDTILITQHSPLSAAFLKRHPVEETLHRLMSLI